MSMQQKIICRFAPSPTGPLHVGGVRTALFNYLFSRQRGGKLILRIEDTDEERSKPLYEQDIFEGFSWLGLSFDETHRQSERKAEHAAIVESLVGKNLAYISKEDSAKEGQRGEVIRFRNPNRRVAFNDLIKGRVEFDTTELGDFVIAKSTSEPLFHLAVVADDASMGITHIIRGEDHLSNTPRQILIREALGAPEVSYAHIPLLLSTDRSKLSKRKHGEHVSLGFYRKEGYLREAMLNFLALLGWNPKSDRELFTIEELVKEFALEHVQKSPAVFNVEKLNWMNRQYLLKKPHTMVTEAITEKLRASGKLRGLSEAQLHMLSEILRERVHYYGEVETMAREGAFDYLETVPTYSKEKLLWKKHPDPESAARHITHVMTSLEGLEKAPDSETVKSRLISYAEKEGKGEVLWPVRFALSGQEQSIDPFNLITILGQAESTRRLKAALTLLQ